MNLEPKVKVNVKDKPFYASKKFTAFVISIAAMLYALWLGFENQKVDWALMIYMCIGIIGIVVLCLGYVLVQAKFDRAMVALVKMIASVSGSEPPENE